MRFQIPGIVLAAAWLWSSHAAVAREIPRTEYLTFVPFGSPRLVPQAAETDSLHVYGDRSDPAYQDTSPADGIDDRRHEILMSLAVRFAPYLAQNTSHIPVNFDTYIDNSDSFALHVDTWETSGQEPHLVRSEAINLSALGAAADAPAEDRKLVEVLAQFFPWEQTTARTGPSFVQSRPELFSVLYFNFPGEGPESWDTAYEAEYERTPPEQRARFPHAYVHPFVASARDADGMLRGYDLVLQYWFYYPSNDGGNNHEGDWEHLNVVVAPLSRVHEPLRAETLRRILDGALPATDDAADPLVIQRLEYYFHHFVMTLDFTSPNVYRPRDEWQADVESRPTEQFQQKEIWRAIRYLAYVDDDEQVLNTHPLAYIGADNKGLDQGLSTPGGKNRNSHGTFPFPGRYHDIGPAGATEQISVHVDLRRYWKRLKTGEATSGPTFERGKVLGLADPQRLRIVPDWERIAGLLATDSRARREWSWLVLPVRWGYPATESPFSGILPNADTGNLAPVGPAFSSGWNVSGAARGFHHYEPHTLPSVFPLGLQDSFRNDFGYFNFTLPVLFNLPPLDFLTRIGTYPLKLAFGRRDPVYFPKETVPYRFFALSSGVSLQVLDEDFRALSVHPEQYDQFVGRLLAHFLAGGDTTTVATSFSEFTDHAIGSFVQVPFYIGRRFTSENMVRNTRSTFGFQADFSNIPSYSYRADLDYWEYAGSLRYGILPSRVQPYVKAGYGWSWYRLENIQANEVPFAPSGTGWIKPKRIWPNVWHVGLGVEYVPWRRVGRFPGGLDLAFRVEYARYMETLGLDLSSVALTRLAIAFPTLGDVPGHEQVHRDDFLFGVSLCF